MSKRIQKVGALLGVFALLCTGIALFKKPHDPFVINPSLKINYWEATQLPVSRESLEALGNPKALAFDYRNPLDERLSCLFVAPHSFEAFREPYPLNLMTVSGQRQLYLGEKYGPIRAWVLKGRTSSSKMIVYSWLQDRKGTLFALSPSTEQTNLDRILFGWRQITGQDSCCLVRVMASIPPSDQNGAQTRRNIEEVAMAIVSARQE